MIARAIDKIQRDGMFSFLSSAYVITRNVIFEGRSAFLLTRDMDSTIPRYEPASPVEIRLADLQDVDAMSTGRQRGEDEIFADRLRQGRIAFLGSVNGQMAGIQWVSLADEYESWLGVPISVPERCAYFFDAFTWPEFRGAGIYSNLMRYALWHVKERGIRRALSVVGISNVPALKCVRRLGFQETEQISTLRIFGRVVRTTRELGGE